MELIFPSPNTFRSCRNIYQWSALVFPQIKKPKDIIISDKQWAKYCGFKIREISYKRKTLKELLEEGIFGTDKSNFIKNFHFSPELLINISIKELKKYNLVTNSSVVDSFLYYLEPFPFDRSQMQINKEPRDENEFSIKQIREEIEKQYFAWKYDLDLMIAKETLNRYKICLCEYRSFRTIMRNIEELEKFPEFKNFSVAEKIYYINQVPFSLENMDTFQKTIKELEWDMFPLSCPKILQFSPEFILIIISSLRDMGFTDKQISEGLPLLHMPFKMTHRKLHFLLTNSQALKHKHEDKFLYLLSCKYKMLPKIFSSPDTTFEELLQIARLYLRSLNPVMKIVTPEKIYHHVSTFFKLNTNCLNNIKKYPKYKYISEKQLYDTLAFLKGLNFDSKEVEESITIIFQPRSLIQKALETIESKKEYLQKYGFTNGCVKEETNIFGSGTKEKQKSLQLCLYYLDKSAGFSLDTILEEEIETADNESIVLDESDGVPLEEPSS